VALIKKDDTVDGGHIISLPEHGLDVSLKCPAEFRLLASKLLIGWSFQTATLQEYDVSVVSDQKNSVVSKRYGLIGRHKDILSTFNVFLNAIAYEVIAKLEKCLLVHAAAYKKNDEHIVVFGNKKAGKSTFIVDQCSSASECISDDLVVWDNECRILSLGFPVRLRRPISDTLVAQLGKQSFLAGSSLAFVNPKSLNQVRAGKWIDISSFQFLEQHIAKSIAKEAGYYQLASRTIPQPKPRWLSFDKKRQKYGWSIL